jgi:hypothetical protein
MTSKASKRVATFVDTGEEGVWGEVVKKISPKHSDRIDEPARSGQQ